MVSGQVNLEIIFVGRSNVGKSTLFSRLFGVDLRKGRKPGTTIRPNFLQFKDLLLTDLPGFGFIRAKNFNEQVKDFIVHYLERHCNRIVAAVHVIDGKSFLEVAERWEGRNEIPIDIEMFDFLNEFTEVLLAINKMDKVENRDETLSRIVEKLGTKRKNVFPISAKKGDIVDLKNALKWMLARQKRYDLLSVFK
jgi:GTP-binding protein EngB required for normal cell division